jgi:aminoglycoside 3-N-acetyltransferase
MSVYRKVLSLSPWLEVGIKSLYWRSSFFNQLLHRKARQRKTGRSQNIASPVEFAHVLEALDTLGAGRTGLMIVHSSAAALAPTRLTPKELCNGLLTYLGPQGTLAMPAIPLFREEPSGVARLGNAICNQRLNFDVRRTPPWTGALPKALMGLPGAVRSRHPLNTMVALGPHAEEMMARNIDGPRPMPCGPQSSWKYCADHDAMIVCLGVDSAHSLTMIHVAEDCWSEQWPVPKWYRERLFHVKDGDFEVDLTVVERHPRWAINYAERTLQKDLLKLGIIKVQVVGGIRIEVCSSARLIEYLCSKRRSGYPYWVPFWDRL